MSKAPTRDLVQTLTAIVDMGTDYPGREELMKVPSAVTEKRVEAAVCILFSGSSFEDAKILLTERSGTLLTHAGQVAFPGGALDPGEDEFAAALRECEEEVGIDPEKILPQGRLPTFPTLSGNYAVHPVLAYLPSSVADHALQLQASEVVHAEWVSIRELMQSRYEESREFSGKIWKAPVFMWGERKIWGLTAWIFDLILIRYAMLLT